MKDSTYTLVIRRLSERARKADERIDANTYWGMSIDDYDYVDGEARARGKCRAKIDQLTEKYS